MSKRERTLVFAVLILAVFGAYYLYFLKPYMEEMSALILEKSSKEVQVTTNEQQELRLENLDAEIADQESQISEYSSTIFQGLDQPPILVYIDETVSPYAQKVMFYFDDLNEVGQLQVCPITITIVSTYDGLKSILDEFSKSDYFIKVTSLTASYSTDYTLTETDEADGSSDTDETDGTETETRVVENKNLDITLMLEFYSMSGDVPENTAYTFDDGIIEYGGDIFY